MNQKRMRRIQDKPFDIKPFLLPLWKQQHQAILRGNQLNNNNSSRQIDPYLSEKVLTTSQPFTRHSDIERLQNYRVSLATHFRCVLCHVILSRYVEAEMFSQNNANKYHSVRKLDLYRI